MATTLPKTGVVLVGAGAAGGVAALPIAQAGIDCIALEAGSWLSTRDMVPDEIRLQRSGWPAGPQKVDGEVPSSRANASQNATRGGNHPMMNGVGGTAMHYMAQAWRLNPWDFKVVSETARRYGAARIPAGSTVEDWPITYEDLEAAYDRVEYELGVSGDAGNINGVQIPAGNIFEGARSREYPMPALRMTGFMERMSGAARSLGWHPFTGPAAILSRPYENRSACVYHGYCMSAGCHVEAKSSPAVSTIPKAMRTGRFQVVTEAHVIRIEVEGERASGVTYLKDNEEFFQPADVVFLAGQTYENVRLLLLSKSPAFPNGLANNRGQVGMHYFSHAQFGSVSAIFPFDLRNWYGTPGQGICVDDYADDNFDHAGLDFIGGGTMYVYGERRPLAAVNGILGWAPQGTPNWGSAWKAWVMENADRTNGAYMQRTTLPYEGNYLDLDPTFTDSRGNPVIRITASFRENENRISTYVGEKMREWYMAAGALRTQGTGAVGVGSAMGTSTHAYGGTRMGRNPETNVVDAWCMAHEVPNLAIMGGSVMGTSGARNPTLTLQALAWRTAEYVARNWNSIAI